MVSLSLALALCLSACTGPLNKDATAPASLPPPTSPSATKRAATAVTVAGVPADLRPLATALYSGGAVASSGAGTAAMKARTRPSRPVTVTGTVGTWEGTPIAVLSSGPDTSLLVKPRGTGWTVVGGWWPQLGDNGLHLGDGSRRVLFLGSDARVVKGQKIDRSRADAIQIAGIDGRGGGGVVGVPRDSWMSIPGHGKDKVNASMVFGGPALTQRTISAGTGLPLDGYVLTWFQGFHAMTNELGKVTVTLPVDVREMKKGRITLDGAQALWVARERKTVPGGDFGRSTHQGVLVAGFAALTRAKGPDDLPQTLTIISKNALSNLSAQQAITFAAWTYKADPTRFGRKIARGSTGTAGGASVVFVGPQARAVYADFRDGNLSGAP
ncbi:MAG: LCP family protein [Micrococcales bacterium]|nr:LCP family protein [Micrococcales bacterium]